MSNKKKLTIFLCFFTGISVFLVFTLISAATPPTVITVGSSDITNDSVTLTGNITNSGDSPIVLRYFEYGETIAYEISDLIFIGDDPFGLPTGVYSESIGGLLGTCGTLYHYRAYAKNEAGLFGYGEDMTFTTTACPSPTVVTTNAATGIGLNSATLNGSIDSVGAPISQRGFVISGTNPNGGILSYTSTETDGQPYGVGAFSLTMNNLSCSTTYTYHAYGGADGGNVSFDTLSCNPPVVETDPAVLIVAPIAQGPIRKTFMNIIQVAMAAPGDAVIRLNGNILDTGGENPVAGFQYGTDITYTGGTIPVGTLGVESYSSDLSSLSLDTTYHYRAYATNSTATSYGADQTFLIASPITVPSVTTLSATSIERTTATLNGTISSTGGENATTVGFQYGLTDSYGTTTTATGSFGAESFNTGISELTCDTTYHYRAYATNSAGTGYGADQTLTTDRCPSNTGNIITVIRTDPDLCRNINGAQIAIPDGMELNDQGDCVNIVVINPPIDVCPNINGEQTIIPNGMKIDNNGNCVKIILTTVPVDLCKNIDDLQETIPDGMELNDQGDCVNIVVINPPIDVCPNINDIQEIIPEGMELNQNGYCVIAPVEVVPEPRNNFIVMAFAFTALLIGAFSSFSKILFVNPISFKEIYFIPMRLWSMLLAFFGMKKLQNPWGTVYDSVTKQPLDPAYIVLQNLDGKEIATSITDLDGRYGFLVPPGKYKMIASKTNYKFPSNKLKGQTEDELYQNLYFNDVIEVRKDEVITKNIPMDPIKFDWNEFEKKEKKLMNFFSKKQLWLSRISNIIFYSGFIVTIIAVITSPITYNIVILALYGLMYILKNTILKPRTYGSIKEKISANPLSFAVLRVFFSGSQNEITHKVADKTGKYYCLIPNGTYYIKIENKNADESYSLVHTSGSIEVKKGYINKKFEV
ncbi:MAG: carboxypeptidase-like regulatory domain-containing protein [Candidatus Paceibacterota bacterium]|jgi:hypothetical protein